MTLTTEQLRARAKFWREKAVEAKWESVSIAQDMLLNADAFDELAANREAQPVMWVMSDDLTDEKIISTPAYPNRVEAEERTIGELTPLYTAPPAPAVPDEATAENVEELSGYVSTYKMTDSERDIAAEVWNACRAAMLAQPVSQRYTLPEGFKLMPLEITDEIAEAIAMEAHCCGGIALCIYEAAPEGRN
ncbi:hypothetical protein SERRSCBI_14140 [Serratia sp. SCBI]|nr:MULTISPECIES: hypothetical protein [Serratia]AIM22426.1 hypothetical protein SERRSCBI_14140 [Serratia sp. SCBI]